MDDLQPFIILAVVLLSVGSIMSWTSGRARSMLDEWAMDEGLQINSAKWRWFRHGPFLWTTSKNQVVLRIEARTPDGSLRTGWARCGSFWWGVFSKQIEVRWD